VRAGGERPHGRRRRPHRSGRRRGTVATIRFATESST
jgi:hypothetical protein